MATSSKTSKTPKRGAKLSASTGDVESKGTTPPKRRGRPKIAIAEPIYVKNGKKSNESSSSTSTKQGDSTSVYENNADLIPIDHIKCEESDENMIDEQIVDSFDSKDPLNLQESVSLENEDYKCRVIKEERIYDDVVVIDSDNCTIQTGVFIKQEPDIERQNMLDNNETSIDYDPIYGELHSESMSSEVKEEPLLYNDDSSSAPECLDLEDSKESIPQIPEKKLFDTSVIKKSSFLDILKDSLKRKSEMLEIAAIKKERVEIPDTAETSTSKPAVPALGKLRNIIGSNFKKLNLNLNERPTIKPELDLENNEDAFFNSSLNSDKTAYECPKCGNSFKWKTTLKFHMFNHLEDKAIECDICFKLFLSTTFLLEHKKKFHVTDRNFCCKDCSGKFESKASLTCHMITHEKRKHYVCNICKEKFTSLFSLNSHKSKHSSAIKYECKPCDVRFKSLKTLSKHINLYHKEELKQQNNLSEKGDESIGNDDKEISSSKEDGNENETGKK